jgi:phage gpG-like protein
MRAPIQIRVLGTRKLREAFQRIRNLGEDPTDLLDIWGATLEASTRSRFDRSAGPGDIPWIPSQRALAQGGKTLVDTGNLESSLRYEVRPGELELGVDGVGASSKFAYVHQFGAVIRPVNAKALKFKGGDGVWRVVQEVTIPARPFLGVDDDDRRDMKEVALEHLRSLLNA